MTAATGRLKMSPTLSMKVRIDLDVYVPEGLEAALRDAAQKSKKVFVGNIHALARRGSSGGKAEIAGWRLYRMDSMHRRARTGWIDVRMNGSPGKVKSDSSTSSYN